MTVFLAVLAAIIGGLIGAVGAAALFVYFGEFIGISDFEGERALGAAFFAAPLGAIAGAMAGCLVVLKRRRHRATDRTGFIAMGIVIVSIVAIYLVLFYEPPAPVLRPGDPQPVMAFELRLPAGLIDSAQAASVRPQLKTHRTFVYPNRNVALREEGNSTILSGEYDFFFRVPDRELHLWLENDLHLVFLLPYGEVPDVEPEFSAWRRADLIDRERETTPDPATNRIVLRTRISWKGQ